MCFIFRLIKSNLLEVIHLRDKATHLLIEELRPCLSQLFQANIINYIEIYEFNFAKMPLLNNSPSMLTLVIPGENETKEIKAIYGEKTYIEVENFLKNLIKIENELNSDNFMCKVSYIAYLEKKKETKANINLINGSEAIDTQLVNIMNNQFNVYKYKFSDIVKKIKTDYDKFNINIMIFFLKEQKDIQKN